MMSGRANQPSSSAEVRRRVPADVETLRLKHRTLGATRAGVGTSDLSTCTDHDVVLSAQPADVLEARPISSSASRAQIPDQPSGDHGQPTPAETKDRRWTHSSRQPVQHAGDDEPHSALGPHRDERLIERSSPPHSSSTTLPSDHLGPRHVTTSSQRHTQCRTQVVGPGSIRMVQRPVSARAHQPIAATLVGRLESSTALRGCEGLGEERQPDSPPGRIGALAPITGNTWIGPSNQPTAGWPIPTTTGAMPFCPMENVNTGDRRPRSTRSADDQDTMPRGTYEGATPMLRYTPDGNTPRYTVGGGHPRALPQGSAEMTVEAVRLNPLPAATHSATTAHHRQPMAETSAAAGTTMVPSQQPSSAPTATCSSQLCRRPQTNENIDQFGGSSVHGIMTPAAVVRPAAVRLSTPARMDGTNDPPTEAATGTGRKIVQSTSSSGTAPSADLAAAAWDEPEHSLQRQRWTVSLDRSVKPAAHKEHAGEIASSPGRASQTELGVTCRGRSSSDPEQGSLQAAYHSSATGHSSVLIFTNLGRQLGQSLIRPFFCVYRPSVVDHRFVQSMDSKWTEGTHKPGNRRTKPS